MVKETKIEWTDYSWSPWWGCTKVSPACKNCYAARWARFTRGIIYAAGQPRVRIKDWKKPLKLNRMAEKAGVPLRVFPSMCDPFDSEVPFDMFADFIDIIRLTPWLRWQLLTKRPENWKERMEAAGLCALQRKNGPLAEFIRKWLDGHNQPPPANVLMGATAEDQEHADERITHLLRIPSVHHFVSCEPLLGPIKLGTYTLLTTRCFVCRSEDRLRQPRGTQSHPINCALRQAFKGSSDRPGVGIGQVIAGGESGHGARPSHPDWFRSLRDQCADAGTPFFFKQWGDLGCIWDSKDDPDYRHVPNPKMGGGQFLNFAGGQGFHGERVCFFNRLGKKVTGRLLDGAEHNGSLLL